MKIQCACGAKYAFDVTPEMVRSPVKLVCQSCGADNSTVVNQLIQQQFGAAVPSVAVPAVNPGTSAGVKAAPAPEIAPPPPGARLVPFVPAASSAAGAPQPTSAPSLRVSVAAHAPAPEAKPVAAPETPPVVPRYPMPRKQHLHSGQDKWLGRGLAAAFALFFAGLGFWGWYAWVGSVPKVYASLRIEEAASSGQLHVQPGDQLVFLHGGRLVRHDFKEGRELWSQQLIDEQKLKQYSKENYDRLLAERDRVLRAGGDWNGELGTLEELIEGNKRIEEANLHLHAHGEAVWVSFTNKVVRYDWQSGRAGAEVELPPGENQFVANDGELLVRLGQQGVLTLNLGSGESKTQRITTEAAPAPADKSAPRATGQAASAAAPSVATNATSRSTGPRRGTLARVTAPALNAADENQRRLNAELKSMNPPPAAVARSAGAASGAAGRLPANPGDPHLVATRHGVFQVASRNVGQRTIAGENVVAFAASVRRLGLPEDAAWTGDLPGEPEIHALPGMTLINAGRMLVALDGSGKKLWEKRLEGGLRGPDKSVFLRETPDKGEGPCVERGGVLYVADGSGVNALEAATGSSKWRTPCTDPMGMVFDERGDLYVNVVVTGGEKADVGVQKLEGATGKPLWKIDREGAATYASGKFLYTIDSYRGDQLAEHGVDSIKTIFYVGPFIRLRRIDMATGKVEWSHVQERFPMDVRIEKNTFQLLFKKEVQLLKFMSF